MNVSKNSLLALAGLILLSSLTLLIVSLAHALAPVGAAAKEKGERKFYLTKTGHNGTAAPTACAAGYHMASVWEIFDPSNLRYDTELGAQSDDSGSGPPATLDGWVRTGWVPIGLISGGQSNCQAWSSSSQQDYGSVVKPNTLWLQPAPLTQPPWSVAVSPCDNTNKVWCVQD